MNVLQITLYTNSFKNYIFKFTKSLFYNVAEL